MSSDQRDELAVRFADELAFWPTKDSVAPDYEILDSLRPGMATVPGAMLLCASSPYARRGALWDVHKRYFGKVDAPVWSGRPQRGDEQCALREGQCALGAASGRSNLVL